MVWQTIKIGSQNFLNAVVSIIQLSFKMFSRPASQPYTQLRNIIIITIKVLSLVAIMNYCMYTNIVMIKTVFIKPNHLCCYIILYTLSNTDPNQIPKFEVLTDSLCITSQICFYSYTYSCMYITCYSSPKELIDVHANLLGGCYVKSESLS